MLIQLCGETCLKLFFTLRHIRTRHQKTCQLSPNLYCRPSSYVYGIHLAYFNFSICRPWKKRPGHPSSRFLVFRWNADKVSVCDFHLRCPIVSSLATCLHSSSPGGRMPMCHGPRCPVCHTSIQYYILGIHRVALQVHEEG